MHIRTCKQACAALLAVLAAFPAFAQDAAPDTVPVVPLAHEAAPEWRARVELYGYLPEIGARMRVPADAQEIVVGKKDLVDHLKFMTMGGFDLRRGRAGLLADAIYVDLGGSLDDSPTVARGGIPLPGSTTADAGLDVKAQIYTLAAYWRALDGSALTTDLFAGARYLKAGGTVTWQFERRMGPVHTPLGHGEVEVSREGWDGVAGLRGRWRPGAQRKWFLPYWIDAGTGESQLTTQASAGLGYAAGGLEAWLVWRYLDYRFEEDRFIDELQFNGPALGFALSW